jgi:hypothetical protein
LVGYFFEENSIIRSVASFELMMAMGNPAPGTVDAPA